MDNIGDNSKRKIICSWYKAKVSKEVHCIKRDITILFPSENNKDGRCYVTNEE